MDEGWVCQVLRPRLARLKNAISVFVSNPIAQSWYRLLPTPKLHLKTLEAAVDMVVDPNAGCYSIFLLPNSRKLASEENPFMVIYESRTNAWRSSSLPVVTEVCVNVERRVVCFNGSLYVLACADPEDALARRYARPGHSWLWSYSHAEDHWKDTGVVVNVDDLFERTFLVSDNRLFLASWVRALKGRFQSSYQVSEIDLQERTLRAVLLVTAAAMMELFEVAVRNRPADVLLHAFGSGKAIILLCMETGITRVYDLRTCTWEGLREDRLLFPISLSAPRPVVCFGKPMNLMIPAATASWKNDVVTQAGSLANV